MISHLHFLPYLLYMNIGITPFDYASEHVFAMKSGAPLPSCNRVFATQGVSPTEIAQVLNFFGTTPFRWFVQSTDALLIQLLEQEGFVHDISFPAMHSDLSTVAQTNYEAAISVKEITDAQLSLWISLAARSYEIPDDQEFAQFVTYVVKKAYPNQLHFYIGYYHDIPAAVSMTIDQEDVVVLHRVGTVPEYRGKGLGYAVSHKPLIDAKERGFSQAILFASTMGKPVYEKIGFKEYALYNVYGYKV